MSAITSGASGNVDIPVLVASQSDYAGSRYHLTRLTGTAMGSHCAISVCANEETDAQQLAHGGWETLRELDRLWSRFRPDSELSRLNSTSTTIAASVGDGTSGADSDPVLSVGVSSELAVLLEAMLWAHGVSAGLVDPSVLPELLAAGYDRDYSQITVDLPTNIGHLDARSAKHSVREHRISLAECSLRSEPTGRREPGLRSVRREQVFNGPAGVLLDSGGVGKGLAADLICEAIAATGARGVVLDLGGDVRAIGHDHNGEAHIVEVNDERAVNGASGGREPGTIVPLAQWVCTNHAVATSSVARRRLPRGHHLIDPRTGTSSRSDLLAVTVRHQHALDAEVAAKTALLLGLGQAQEWLRARRIQAILTTRSGSVVHTLPNDRAERSS